MNNSTNTNSTVYVELTALTSWSSQMKEINENSISTLNSLISTINDLNDYWIGNLASGFIEDSNSLVKSVQKCHYDMESISNYLIDYVNTKESE